MARFSFGNLPPEGAKHQRDISRVVNQTMDGKTNNVGDIVASGQDISDANFLLLVNDIRVSEQSYISIEPKSVNAFLLPSVVLTQGKGFFIMAFSDPDDPYGYGQGQVVSAVSFTPTVGTVFEQILTGAFTEAGQQINVAHSGNGILTVENAGTYVFFVTCSLGLVPIPNNDTISFGGIRNNDPNQAFGADWTRRSNAVGVPMSFGGYVELLAGDTMASAVKLEIGGQVQFDSVTFNLYSLGVTVPPALLPSDEFLYRYVVIG